MDNIYKELVQFKKFKENYIFKQKTIENLGVAQVVARYLGVVEAVGSSPATQTISSVHNGFEL